MMRTSNPAVGRCGSMAAWLVLAASLVVSGQAAAPAERHAATVTLQMLPPAVMIGQAPDKAPNMEEITRAIRRQAIYIRSEQVVQRVLQADEVQRDPSDPTRKSAWIREHPPGTVEQFLKDLEVAQIPDSDLFTIKFTASSSAEAARIVNNVTRVYLDGLRMDNRIMQAERLEEFEKILNRQEEEVRRQEQLFADYCKAHDVDLVTSRPQIAMNVLGQIELDVVRAQVKAATAQEALASMKKQAEAGTLLLSLEMEQMVDNDPQVRMLEQAKLALAQDAAVQSHAGKNKENEAEQRLGVVEKQLQERRETLEVRAKVHIQEQAKSGAARASSELQQLTKVRDMKALEVRDFAYSLDQAQKSGEAIKTQRAILASLRQQYTMQVLNSGLDDTRVRKIGGDAVAGREFSK